MRTMKVLTRGFWTIELEEGEESEEYSEDRVFPYPVQKMKSSHIKTGTIRNNGFERVDASVRANGRGIEKKQRVLLMGQ